MERKLDFQIRPVQAFEESRADDPLGEFLVNWDVVTHRDEEALSQFLETRSAKAATLRYLESNPCVLVQHLTGGHGRWVMPQRLIGSDNAADFLIAHKDSGGYNWTAVQVESAQATFFTKGEMLSARLSGALERIAAWRTWVEANLEQARRPRIEGGLGLTHISSRVPGMVIMGRRTSLSEGALTRRREIGEATNTQLHSYDWLVESIQSRATALRGERSRHLRVEEKTARLRAIHPGRDEASAYHDFILDALTKIFSPGLHYPRKEREIDNGRKRIDIVFTNRADSGFFHALNTYHRVICPYIFIECKNYSEDLANPEVDQLLGRFSDQRGTFGFLVCRSLSDPDLMLARCKDAANRRQGFIIALTDDDIETLLRLRVDEGQSGVDRFLDDRFSKLIM